MKVLNWQERSSTEQIILQYLIEQNKNNPNKNYFGLIINGTDVRVVLKDKQVIEMEKEYENLFFPAIEGFIEFYLNDDGLLGITSGGYESCCLRYWIKGNCYYIHLEGNFEVRGIRGQKVMDRIRGVGIRDEGI